MRPLFLLMFLIPQFLFSQHNSNLKYILGISKYRSELIGGNTDNLKDLKYLTEKWEQYNLSKEEKSDLLLNILHAKRNKWSFKSIKKKIISHYDFAQEFALEFTESDLEIMATNSHMMNLIDEYVLELEFPFKIDPETEFFKELNFYNIQDGMKIGEIGAGSGAISTLLAIIFENVEIYINELDWWALNYIEEKLNKCKSLNPSNKIRIVQGKKKTGNLEGLNLDRMIIRNSFHHFSKKEEMLASIKQSLKNDGELYILEVVTEKLPNDADYCPYRISSDTIKNHLEKSGFEFIDAIKIWDYTVIFKYKIKK